MLNLRKLHTENYCQHEMRSIERFSRVECGLCCVTPTRSAVSISLSLSLCLACSLSFSHPSVSTLKRGLYHICPSTDFPTVIAIIFGPAQCAICITFCPLQFATFGCAWVGSERQGEGGSNCAESARGELVIQSACIQTCNSNFKTIFNLLTERLPDWLGPAAASVAAPTAAATPA